MEISRLSDLRPRTVWDVADDAFDLYRENFALFAGITAALFVPYYIVLVPWMASWYRDVQAVTGSGDNPFSALAALAGIFFLIVPLSLFLYFVAAGVVAGAVEDRLAGRATGVLPAYRRVLSRFWPLAGASLLVALLGLLGIALLYIGTVVFLVYYGFASQAVVLERRGARAALRRSRDLVWGYGSKVFGLLVLLLLLWWTLSLGVSSLIQIAMLVVPALKQGDVAAQQMRQFMMDQVAQSLSAVLLAPLAPIAMTLLYYDLRVRREGLDIEAQAAAIGYPLAPDPFGGVANPKTPRAAPPGAVNPPS